DGYRYLQDYDLGKPEPTPVLRSMELGPRDRLSQAFVHEVDPGRTIESPYGPIVNLDLRHLGGKLIEAKLPMVRELCMQYERIDPVKELIPVRPVVHYMMGGVHTDINGATPIEGLFAAGETACVTINGANRLGSNSLPECLVFCARAGRAAAEDAASARQPPRVVMRQVEDEIRRIDQIRTPDRGSERIADIREEMQATMEDSAGIFRSGESLSKGVDELAALQQPLERVQLHDETRVFNTELLAALELANMLDIAETILQSALQREESRGAHQRTDFTARDDTRFLNHALAYRDADGAVRIERSPVTITRWPPGERVYGREPQMAARIQIQVTRYDPDQDAAPSVATYAVPLSRDWAVLDGLNYIKDHIDGSLSFRWSSRMGICGSCGMKVEGEPKLTCATCLTAYAP